MTFGVDTYTATKEDYIFCAKCGKQIEAGEKIIFYYCKHDKCYSAIYVCQDCYVKKEALNNIRIGQLHDMVNTYCLYKEKGYFFNNDELKKYYDDRKKKESER